MLSIQFKALVSMRPDERSPQTAMRNRWVIRVTTIGWSENNSGPLCPGCQRLFRHSGERRPGARCGRHLRIALGTGLILTPGMDWQAAACVGIAR